MGCDPFVDPECPSPEFPYHSLELSDFSIEKYEVTVARYEQCVLDGTCSEPDTEGSCNWGVAGREHHPINCVDYEQAVAFCAWAGRRLPTEAEWEKATRGTSGQLYPWGDDLPTCEYAIIAEDGADGCGTDTTSEVGARAAGASPYGALDMGGNVWEWVADWFDYYYYQTSPATDPQGPETGTYRGLRGGSYQTSDADRYARGSHRNARESTTRTTDAGFRCAVSGLSGGGAGGAGSGVCPPDCDELVDVPAGDFWMGCDYTVDPHCVGPEFPYHEVHLDAFDLDRYEVTVLQYRECVEQGPCSLPNEDEHCNYALAGHEYHPVNCIDWDQASTYCDWAGKRLPTEAEWEKAARGTEGALYPWGDAPATCAFAVINDGSGDGCGTNGTLPVGSRPAGVSPYGVHDLVGNALEWVADWYDYSYYWVSPASNPTGPDATDDRSARGSAWFWDEARWHRASQRNGFEPSSNGNAIGFRCARSAP